MNVRIFEMGEVPAGLALAVLGALPWPFVGERLERLVLDIGPIFDPRRGQVEAFGLLGLLPAPPAGVVALGLTGHDLYLSALTYVFGLSELGSRRGVLSSARLCALEQKSMSPLGVRRVLIEAVHELGHTVGLLHCPIPSCAMHRTLWPEAVELKSPTYCPACREAISIHA